MLRFVWYWVVELYEGSFHIFWHGEVNFMLLVVPIECNSKVSCFASVFFYFVVFLECFDEVHDVFLSDAFYAEIIDDQCKTDGAPIVLPISWCGLALGVPCIEEAFFE
jgi:hypothetical protein